MFNMSKEARAKRMNVVVNPGQEISLRAYNLILTGTVLYGLAINALLCRESIVNYVFNRVNPIVFFIVYFVCAFGGVFLAHRSDRPAISFLGYNLIVIPMGLTVGMAVVMGGYNPSVVWHAVITTAGVTVIMVAAGLLFPQFFAKIGSILFFGLIGVLLGLTDFAYWLFITDLGVDRAYERRGIGSRLMRTVLEIAGGDVQNILPDRFLFSDNEQRDLPRGLHHDLPADQQLFPPELQQQGQEEIQPVHVERHFTGIGDADPEGIEGQGRQEQVVHRQLERPDDFHVEGPAQDPAVGVHKQRDNHIQRQHQEQVPDPDLTGVAGQGKVPELHPVGQQEANQQGNQVNHHEIQMLQP